LIGDSLVLGEARRAFRYEFRCLFICVGGDLRLPGFLQP
jgi:hypothetical protein